MVRSNLGKLALVNPSEKMTTALGAIIKKQIDNKEGKKEVNNKLKKERAFLEGILPSEATEDVFMAKNLPYNDRIAAILFNEVDNITNWVKEKCHKKKLNKFDLARLIMDEYFWKKKVKVVN